METNKSEVFTVEDWYDGPLLGLAEYNGQTCVYRRVGEIEYDDSQDDLEQHRDCSQAASGIYKLTPISDDEKEQILSEWAIWCESKGKITNDVCALVIFADLIARGTEERQENLVFRMLTTKSLHQRTSLFELTQRSSMEP